MNIEEKKPISEKNALSRMMSICAKKEYCTFDIKQKLYKLQIPADNIEKIIAELKKNKFIDDERYVQSYISDKVRFSKWGVIKIRYTLRQKQISDDIINACLSKLESNTLTENLMTIIEQKYRSVKGKTVNDKRNKVIRFALGRGFAMPDIIKCLDKISIPEDEPW